SNPGLEANQNIQYTVALTYLSPLIFYLQHEQKNILQTVTASYYGVDKDDFPPGVANTICILFKQLGVRGVSALTDDGAGKGNYKDTSGNVHFRPFFPASYPWVTMVGGTTGLSEQAASLSGGGLLNYYF
ncbi:hypothetical protein EDB85DRAFT_1864654, partial [Lactarius pseudohatsudake]